MSGVVERRAVGRDHAGIELRARFRRALERAVVDVDETETLGEAVGPFEVVEQRPGEVTADVGALLDRVMHGTQMRSEVVDTQRIVDEVADRMGYRPSPSARLT